ncbi:MAG: hypothetical protein AB7T63_11975 [Planctomycetota bacterium]
MSKSALWTLLGIAGLVLIAVVVLVFGGEEELPPLDPVPLEISYRTTRLTEPLTPGGHVDYLAVLNAGTPPPAEENATVALLRVLGTGVMRGRMQEGLDELGAPPGLPVEGSFVEQEFDTPLLEDVATASEEELVALDAWLSTNEEALQGFVDACGRPSLWGPLTRDLQTGYVVQRVEEHWASPLVNALAQRAELRRVRGDVGAGWADAKALLAWSRLLNQRPGILARLLERGAGELALDWLVRVLESGRMPEAMAREALGLLQRHVPADRLARDLDEYERFVLLGSFTAQMVRDLEPGGEPPLVHEAYVALNPALQAINDAYDEALPLLRTPSPAHDAELDRIVTARAEHYRQLGRALDAEGPAAADVLDSIRRGDDKIARTAGDLVASTGLVLLHLAAKRYRAHVDQRATVTLALALHLHHLDHGTYPEDAHALVPAYLADIPISFATGEPMPYDQVTGACRIGSGDHAIELPPPAAGR